MLRFSIVIFARFLKGISKYELYALPGATRSRLELSAGKFPLLSTGLSPYAQPKNADIGASTGGFSDCMLQNGAKKVYAIDVGYGQLAWKLRTDERVVNLERTNFRYVTREQVPDEIDFASVDVSFISLKLILPVMHTLLRDGGRSVCLIKPQFEAGKENIGKKGVVRDKSVHTDVIARITEFAAENGFAVLDVDFSPIKGPEGNIEYLMFIEKREKGEMLWGGSAKELADKSHESLDKPSEEAAE